MRPFVTVVIAMASLLVAQLSTAKEPIPLSVLYLGRKSADRTEAFQGFLEDHFAHVVVAKRPSFQPELLDGIDIVVLDWSQSERDTDYPSSPIGEFDDWSKPLVMLGSAGLLMADSWQVIGDAG